MEKNAKENDQMLVLGLDASAVAGSCAICELEGEKSRVIAESFVNTKQTHSQTLLPMVEDMLKSSGVKLEQIDRIAVTSGPGSFTGIRIGVSAVKGLCYAMDIPCVGVSTLHALACNLWGFENSLICAVMDARCNQFYNALFRADDNSPKRITPDRAISAEELSKELTAYSDSRIILVGDGAELAQRILSGVNTELAPMGIRLQKAESVCLASIEYEAVSARELLPTYLRLPQAERERLAKLNTTL